MNKARRLPVCGIQKSEKAKLNAKDLTHIQYSEVRQLCYDDLRYVCMCVCTIIYAQVLYKCWFYLSNKGVFLVVYFSLSGRYYFYQKISA